MSMAWVWRKSWKRTPVSLIDLALIDAVIIDEIFIGSKAIWDFSQVREVYTTQGHPSYIGVTSIGGSPHPIRAEDDHGLYLRIGKGMTTVSMEYSHPWEGGEKGEWTFSLTIIVK